MGGGRNAYPERGRALETFRAELARVWSAVSSCGDPAVRLRQAHDAGIWIGTDSLFLTNTKRLVATMARYYQGCRKKSSVNSLLNALGCTRWTFGSRREKVMEVFPFLGEGGESRRWLVRTGAEAIVGPLAKPKPQTPKLALPPIALLLDE